MDYRALLIKYMAIIISCEGHDYLIEKDIKRSGIDISSAELNELLELSDKADFFK